MTSIEIGEIKRLAASYAMERVMPFEDVTGLASALVRRYLLGLGTASTTMRRPGTPPARTPTAAPGPSGPRSPSTRRRAT